MVAGDKVIFGGRDGFLYALDRATGKMKWQVDHNGSWIISSFAIKDSIVVTGTSDGHFVQGIELNSGKEIWKFHTASTVWSSPCIDGNKVYIGTRGQGILFCLDLRSGVMLDNFLAGGMIHSSPVISGSLLYFGADNGSLYALRSNGLTRTVAATAKKYVFWQAGGPYFKYGTDQRIKRYLSENGYGLIDKRTLIDLFTVKDSAPGAVVVFASNYFPPEITEGADHSLIRNYLNNGGKIVVTGINPLFYKTNPRDSSIPFRNYSYADSVLSIKYGPDDLRSQKGDQPAFPTKAGIAWGLKDFWVAPLSLPKDQVELVSGEDENGLASAWVKKYSSSPGSGFVQIWISENSTDMSLVARVAEYGLH